MRKLILRMLITLDGVAAGENGQIDGVDYGDEGSWADIFETLKTVDTFLLGEHTYEEYLDHWKEALTKPGTPPKERQFAEIDAKTQHCVLSRKLRSVDFPNASVLEGGVDGIAKLKQQSGGDILLWGGPTIAAAAIEANVVDEYHLEVHPIIAGRGKKLFDKVVGQHPLRHLDTKALSSGVNIVKYANR